MYHQLIKACGKKNNLQREQSLIETRGATGSQFFF
jgi:hypothetical protein